MRLLPLLAVALVVVITPSVDMALVTKNALIHGRTAALATALGVKSGIVPWTVAAALGLAAVVQASAVTFAVIRFAGAVLGGSVPASPSNGAPDWGTMAAPASDQLAFASAGLRIS